MGDVEGRADQAGGFVGLVLDDAAGGQVEGEQRAALGPPKK